MQATILRNEGIIQMLKAQLQQQQMKDEDKDERFLNREISEEASVSFNFFKYISFTN